jgi:hypothetical protein
MKKIIEVKRFSAPAGKEYEAAAYPGPGIYQSDMGWFLIYQLAPTGALCSMNLGTGYNPPIPMEDYVEAKLETRDEPQGVTASDLLKAIAISQNPLLAKELLR